MIEFCHTKTNAGGQFLLNPFVLTARQYGEVVLPDASTGQHPGSLAAKWSTVQGGYGALFAVMVQILLSIRCDRGTRFLSGRELIPVDEFDKWALVQYRGTNCHGARNWSWCRILIAGRCAYPGATAITNLSWVQEQKQKV